MRFIDANQVHQALEYPALINGLDRYHREDTDTLDDLLIGQPSATENTDHFFIRAAWQRGRAVGAKIITVFPDNPSKDPPLPAVHAIYALFDGVTGEPSACMDGTALTYRKTAADSALGASYLARDNVETMLMVGAGAMAPHLIAAHCAARPSIREVSIWNRNRS
ncbi:MAG: ornithine cyclodeaminase, partial [Gammaproteobacteria bacterium]|nr:ornithine cyclodeaminase [Gammaproteobacteria bacterium]